MKRQKKILITGGAGFIGSQLADYFLLKEYEVLVIDNLSWGKKLYFEHNLNNKNYKFVKLDLLNKKDLTSLELENIDTVFHLAANSDISRSAKDPKIDLNNTTIVTFNLLEKMRNCGIKKIFYFSGSGVYGDVGNKYTSEKFGPLCPVSMYGATKLSAEAMISAYVNLFDMKAWILRPANIIGPRATHGVIFDFINQLKKHKNYLKILGDGKQSKSYLYVEDVIKAVDLVWNKANKKINIFNIASNSFISVTEIANEILKQMKLKNTEVEYTGGNIGWKGDVPVVRIDNHKINKLGWKVKYSSKQAVSHTIGELLKNEV